MSKKSFNLFLLLALFMVCSLFSPFAIINPSVESTAVKNTANILSNSQAPFIINSNNQLAALASSGNGSVISPFLLKNYVIVSTVLTSNYSNIGITLANTTAYFVLQNISVSHCGIGVLFNNVTGGSIINSHLWNNFEGIEIKNSTLGTFSGNNISSNNYGFLLKDNSADLILDNNSIKNNNFGIYSVFLGFNGVVNSSFSNNQVDLNGAGFYFLNYQFVNDSFISNTVNNNKNTGILFSQGSNDTFVSNIADNNGQDGFLLVHTSSEIYLDNMANNNGQNGFYFEHSNFNFITGNQAMNNSRSGFVFNSPFCNYNVVSNNKATSNKANGFVFTQFSSNNITSNSAFFNKGNGFVFNTTSIDNSITGNSANYNSEDGFYLANNKMGGTAVYQNNMINNLAFENYNNGIEIQNSTNVKITGTRAFSNLIGITIHECYNVSLTNNSVNSNREDGIYIDSIQGSTVSNNTALDNGWVNYFSYNSQIVAFSSNVFPINVPTVPLNVTWVFMSNNEINITWSSPVSNGGGKIIAFKIYRSIDGIHYSLIGNTSKLFFIDTSPVKGMPNTYEISAVNSAGESLKSYNLKPVLNTAFTDTNSLNTSHQLLATLANQVILILFWAFIIVLVGLIACSYISYRRYNLKVDQKKKMTFKKYLQKILHKKKRTGVMTVNDNDIDKSLEIIEEILDDHHSTK